MRAIAYTLKNTTDDIKAILRGLPFNIEINAGKRNILMLHGTPESNKEKIYRFKKKEELWEMTGSANADTLLTGSTHTAFRIMLEQQEQGNI